MAVSMRIDLERFETEGYLVVDGVLDHENDLDPVIAEYTALLDELASRWQSEGKLSASYRDLPFPRRLAQIFREVGIPEAYRYLDISLPGGNITEETPIHLGPAVFSLLTNPRLLDAVEQFIGPEIYSNPIQHVRIKPPEKLIADLPGAKGATLVARTDWHQDQGVHLPEADQTNLLTVWLPVLDATVENGCLCVIPRSHLQGLVTHCEGGTIPEKLRPGVPVPVPIRRGGVLFLHRRTMHASLSNLSEGVRWSFDLRYNPIGQPTGRPQFPGFVARSRRNPESALRDWRAWADLWYAARARLSRTGLGKLRRWTGEEPACA